MDRSSDQWKTGGDCRECRRKNYCRTQCSANKRFNQALILEVIARSKAGQMMAAVRGTLAAQGGDPDGEG